MVRRRGVSAKGLVLLALLLASGCAGPSASPWRAAPSPRPVEGPQAAVFCYKTLADVACYFERDEAVPGRLVAVYPRPVGDPFAPSHWHRHGARDAVDPPEVAQ